MLELVVPISSAGLTLPAGSQSRVRASERDRSATRQQLRAPSPRHCPSLQAVQHTCGVWQAARQPAVFCLRLHLLTHAPHVRFISCCLKQVTIQLDLRKMARRGSGEMADDLYTLIGYQVEAAADWRRGQAESFPTMTGMREPRKSLSGLLWKLINWKARRSTNEFASRLTV